MLRIKERQKSKGTEVKHIYNGLLHQYQGLQGLHGLTLLSLVSSVSILPVSSCAPAILASLLFLKHIRHTPVSKPLHLLSSRNALSLEIQMASYSPTSAMKSSQ